MSSRQLEFGADFGNCHIHGVLESSSSRICNKRAPRVSFHTDREDVLGQSLVAPQCSEVREVGKNHKRNSDE